jgi:large subunit ribosomal protein L18
MKGDSASRRRVRHLRIRRRIAGTAERPRMSVFRSAKHISVQLIDDTKSATLVAASTCEKDLKGMKQRATCEGAKRLGEVIAERAKAKGIQNVVFDRGGYLFHGRVKALADSAREKGLKF